MADCKIPEIPFASGIEQNLQRMLAPIKETLDIWAGRIGDPLCRHVTYEDLLDEAIVVNIGGGGGSGSIFVRRSGDSMAGDLDMISLYQIVNLQTPAAIGEAIRQTVNITEVNLETLTDNSIANALHRHSELVASDGSPDPALSVSSSGNINMNGAAIEINSLGSGNRSAYIDFHGDDTYTDYGLRIQRGNTGANAPSYIYHRGTGTLNIRTTEAANIAFLTTSLTRFTIASDGNITQANGLYFATDEIRARDSGGLLLRDDSGTLGITIADGGLVSLLNGTGINEFSIDGTLVGDSDDAVPTEQAVKTYVDTEIAGVSGLFNEVGSNIFGGTNAGSEISAGTNNFYGGISAGRYGDSTGNTFIGYQAGRGTTANVNGDSCFFGFGAGFGVTTGVRNIAMGVSANYYLLTGSDNVAVGYRCLLGVAANANIRNTAMGSECGEGLTTGSNNLLLGYKVAETGLTTGSNNILLGYAFEPLSATANNQFGIGNSSYSFLRGDMLNYQLAIYGANGYLNFNTTLGSTGYGIRDNSGVMEYKDSAGSWTTFASLSDISLKKNIFPWDVGLDFIDKLQPAEFEFKNKPGEYHNGLIAQQVKEVMDVCGVKFSGWYEKDDEIQGLRYQEFILPLINAVKELKKEIEELKACLPTPLDR